MNKKEFGKYISALRKERYEPKVGRCWSQKELADKANLSTRTVGDIERGQRVYLDCETIKNLAQALELSGSDTRELLKMAACAEYGDSILEDE